METCSHGTEEKENRAANLQTYHEYDLTGNTLPFYFDKNIKHLRSIKYSSKQASCHIYDTPKVT